MQSTRTVQGQGDLTKPESIDRLWEIDIHYMSTVHDGTAYLMSIKDCLSKKWISYEFSRSCTATDELRAVEKACAVRFPGTVPHDLVLRTDNGPQYSALRNIYDLPMEVWFRKVWEHPNSYGHGYNREDMAEAVRMQGRIKGERISSPLGRIWESRADCMLRRPYRISQIPTEMQPPRCHGGGMR